MSNNNNTSVRVIIGSASQLKIKAIRQAFDAFFPGKPSEIYPFAAPSEIASQPVGNEETILGARNRLKNCKKLAEENKTDWDYACAIENGIVEVEKGVWFDIGWIIIEERSQNRQALAVSTGIQFPTECVQAARQKGFQTTTVGDILSTKYPQLDKNDPHLFLSSVSRVEYLQQAAQACVGQLESIKKNNRLQ